MNIHIYTKVNLVFLIIFKCTEISGSESVHKLCWNNNIQCFKQPYTNVLTDLSVTSTITNGDKHLDILILISNRLLNHTYLLHGAESFLSSWMACS